MTDLNGIIFKYLRIIRLESSCRIIFTPFNRIRAWLRKIQVGEKCRFYGNTIFYRYPESSIKIGRNCIFRSSRGSNLIGLNHSCIIATHSRKARIELGHNCGMSGTVIGASGSVILGNRVLCGANTVITDFDWHNIQPGNRSTGKYAPAPVVIENNVWIGLNSVVLKGVRIGENSIIGANSLVTHDIPPNVIAAGNPCRVIKELPGA